MVSLWWSVSSAVLVTVGSLWWNRVNRPRRAVSHRHRAGLVGRSALDHVGVERPGQPDVLRDVCVPDVLWLLAGEGREAHARRAPEGQGRGLERAAREDGARYRGDAGLRAVGHVAEGRLSGTGFQTQGRPLRCST